MANKYLDESGLSQVWNKIKTYLDSWKTTNFGSGTYSNEGKIKLLSGGNIELAESGVKFNINNKFEMRVTDDHFITPNSITGSTGIIITSISITGAVWLTKPALVNDIRVVAISAESVKQFNFTGSSTSTQEINFGITYKFYPIIIMYHVYSGVDEADGN